MDLATLPAETDRAKTKLTQVDLRRERNAGWGATTGGQALTRSHHARLTEGVTVASMGLRKGNAQRTDELVVLLRELSPGVLALSAMQTVLHSIGKGDVLRDTLLALGSAIANECWAADLTGRNSDLAARLARTVKLSHASSKRRYKEVKRAVDSARDFKAKEHPKYTKEQIKRRKETAATLIGFKEREWSRPSLLTAGQWLYNILITSLPEVFERVEVAGTSEEKLSITPAGWKFVNSTLDHAAASRPVFWPLTEAPKPWTDFTGGCSHDGRVSGAVGMVRTIHKDTKAAVKAAIADGSMKPALDALNALQAVPFRINWRVLEVLQVCEDNGIKVAGMVPPDLVIPEKPNAFAWEDMGEDGRHHWNVQRAEKRKTNIGYIGDRVLFKMDMDVAYAMLNHERFYTPMNMDWRGRVYGLCSFNFQREDRVRSLFLFADGLPIGEDGLKYLKMHTANCGDFKVAGGIKISKRSIEERVTWCDTNRQMITNIASAPLVHTEWMQAGKPFLFLAACFELAQALEQGSAFITRLPTSYDGSCSGLQHLSGMTLADEGQMVNLTSSLLPEDVYQRVADDAYEVVKADLLHEPDPHAKDKEAEAKKSADIRVMAALFLAYDGDRRGIVKRNVMTFSYSSQKFGMGAQQQEDLMEPLARKVLEGSLAVHPFAGYCHGPYNKDGERQPSKAARYIAGRVFEAIKRRIHKPAEAMEMLQQIAKAMAHEGKPTRWTTPVGLPWVNRYHPVETTTVNLYLMDGGIKERVRINLATGSMKEIDKGKSANGIAPNVVHALDASHLLLSVRAAVAAGIRSIATVHDSFGCLAPQAAEFNRIIREQFTLMYETHDVLAEILERARADLTSHDKLPPMITKGNLNLKDILNADFAFA